MNKKLLAIITLFLFGLTAVILTGKATAFPFNPHSNSMGFAPPFATKQSHGMPPGGPLGPQLRMIQTLGLSHNQQQQVKSIISEFRPQVQANIISLQQGREQLKSMAGSELNETTINNLADTQGKSITSLIKLRGKISQNIRSILTPEQKQQLSSMIASRPNHMGSHFPFNR